MLRDRLIPLCRLRQVLDLSPRKRNGNGNGNDETEESVLVVNVGGAEVGLVVDNFRSGIDIIIKPLDGILAGFDSTLAPHCLATAACFSSSTCGS